MKAGKSETRFCWRAIPARVQGFALTPYQTLLVWAYTAAASREPWNLSGCGVEEGAEHSAVSVTLTAI